MKTNRLPPNALNSRAPTARRLGCLDSLRCGPRLGGDPPVFAPGYLEPEFFCPAFLGPEFPVLGFLAPEFPVPEFPAPRPGPPECAGLFEPERLGFRGPDPELDGCSGRDEFESFKRSPVLQLVTYGATQGERSEQIS